MLRLRHDDEFSCALWDQGFRVVAADLDPKFGTVQKESWTKQLLEAGVLGVGGAANPFVKDTNSPENLVCCMRVCLHER